MGLPYHAGCQTGTRSRRRQHDLGAVRRTGLDLSRHRPEARRFVRRHGEATSEPAHPNTDAILAIDIDDGSIQWSFQATANDIFLGRLSA